MKWRLFYCFVAIMVLISSFKSVDATSSEVQISLPNFKVSLNEVQVENTYRQYPLIVYKDITYFPATFYDSRFLGLETKWDDQKGLFMTKTNISGAFRENKTKNKNASSYKAKIVPFAIDVNGKTISNNKEIYPLLVFRDVTYFPLTWRFAREEFGWNYNFDNVSGLNISSDNPVPLEKTASKYNGGSFVASKNHLYYSGENGMIYQTPTSNLQNAKNVYQLPIWSYGDGKTYVMPRFTQNDEGAWLIYHQGGATMGYYEYIRLNENAESEIIERGYLTFKNFGDITIKIGQGVPPGPGNLSIKHIGQEYKSLGDPNYIYGWDWFTNSNSSGGSASSDLYLKDSFVYLLGFNMDTDSSRIHKVNILTNQTSRVSQLTAKSFKMQGSNIYFVNQENLYSLPIDSGTEAHIKTSGPVSKEFQIEVLGDAIYYVNETNNLLYNTLNDQPLNSQGKVKEMKQEQGYIICIFEENKNNPYNLIIFDKNSQIVFKSADLAEMNSISIDGDTLYYSESHSKKLYSVKLNR